MSLSDDDNDVSYYASSDSLSNDNGARSLQSLSPEEDNEEDNAHDTGSQVMFDTSDMAGPDFLMPGGLNLFSVALPVKTDKLALKDLPKRIKTSRTCKKNFRVTIEAQNVAIKSLRKIAFSKNYRTRSIHNVAKEALKRGLKSLDNVARKMVKLKDDLGKKTSNLLVVLEKLCKAIFE